MRNRETSEGRSKRRRWLWGIGIVLAVALVARMAAPSLIESHVNKVLTDLEGYGGSIEDVDLALFRGAYRVEGLVLEKDDGEAEDPFLVVPGMDLSLEWKALLAGGLVGELVLEEPKLSVLAATDDRKEQLGEEGDWLESLQSLFPFVINRFVVVDGTVWFGVNDQGPLAKLKAADVQVLASNITNVETAGADELPSRLVASASLVDGAPASLEGSFDLTGEALAMDMELKCEPIELEHLNPVLEKYANLDVRSGLLGLYAECAIASGEVEGYLKFLARNIDVFELGEEDGGVLSKAWEAMGGFLITLTENRSEDQFAAKVPFSGKTEDLSAGVLASVQSLLRNAFVQALSGEVDNSISLADLERES